MSSLSFSFCLSGSVLISSWFSKDIFLVFPEKSTDNLTEAPLQTVYQFFLIAFRIHCLWFFLFFIFFYCSGFCHTLKWNSHGVYMFTADPPSHVFGFWQLDYNVSWCWETLGSSYCQVISYICIYISCLRFVKFLAILSSNKFCPFMHFHNTSVGLFDDVS